MHLSKLNYLRMVEYCILQKNYNIYEINELLFQYDQPLLGA